MNKAEIRKERVIEQIYSTAIFSRFDESVVEIMADKVIEISDQENKELRAKLYSYGETIRRQEEEEDELIKERIELKSRIEELKLKFSESAYKAIELAQPFDIDRQNDAKQMIEQTLTQEKDES